jgi:hypothetical protein
LTCRLLERLPEWSFVAQANRSLGIMGSSRDIIMRTILVIAALLLLGGAPVLASDIAEPHAHHHHGKGDQSPNRHHEADRLAELEAHCLLSFAPLHCEVCLDRKAIQASALRQREHRMALRDLRLSWSNLEPAHTSGPDGGHRIAPRPPDTQAWRALSSRPLSLANRFRI